MDNNAESDEPTESARMIGWRLDLVRHRSWWKGSGHLKAKLELFTLLARCQCLTPALEVIVYTDIETWRRSYQRWLADEGFSEISLPERFQICIVESQPSYDSQCDSLLSPQELSQLWLASWLEKVDGVIEKQWVVDKRLFSEKPPEYLDQYQQSMHDSILGVWSE